MYATSTGHNTAALQHSFTLYLLICKDLGETQRDSQWWLGPHSGFY